MRSEDPIPNTKFSTNDLPDAGKYAAWHESIACIFEVNADRETREDQFFASVDAYLLDDLFLAETSTRAQAFHRTEATIAADGMDHYMLQVYTGGSQALEVKDDVSILRQGGIVVYDLARTSKSLTTDFTNLSLIVPREKMEGLLEDKSSRHMQFFSADQPLAKLLHDNIKLLHDIAPTLNNHQAMALAPSILSLVAANLNGSIEAGQAGNAAGTSALKVAAKDIIAKNLMDPELNAEVISYRLGVARSKLYQAFEDQGGVMNFIRTRRIRAAAEMLSRPEMAHIPLNGIASRIGFGSMATFTRSFRQAYEMSPRDYRVQSMTGVIVKGIGASQSESYGAWLHNL